jgi:hypothetical protein
VADTSLADLFEYVYTTKELDYTQYLSFAGLEIEKQSSGSNDELPKLTIKRLAKPSELQSAILNSWMGE